MPTKVTQSAPKAWLSAVRCGTAVIWTMPSGMPMPQPSTRRDDDPLPVDDAVVKKRAGDGQNHTELAGPDAVAGGGGELIHFSERMKRALAMR